MSEPQSTEAQDRMPEDSAVRAPADATGDSGLHDMGGAIGAASIRGSSAPADADIPEDAAAPKSGYAESLPDATVGADAPRDSPVSGSDQSGDIAPTPVAGAPSEYLSIDDADNLGRGADGETAARLEQKEEHGL
jgi:hypothetical protein